MSLIASQYLKTSDEIGDDSNKYILDNAFILGRSKNLSEPVFTKLPMHITKSNMVKDQFKVQVRPMDF